MSYENELRVIAKMRLDGKYEESLSWKAAEEIKALKYQFSEAKLAANIECPFCSSMDGPDTMGCYCGGSKKAVDAAMELFAILEETEESARDSAVSPAGRLIQVCKNVGFSTLEAKKMVKAAAEQRAAQAEREAVRECEKIATQHVANARHVAYRIRNRWPQHFKEGE